VLRIDTHHHMIPPDYRNALRKAGIDEAGGRALPDWSPEGSLQTMDELGVATAILSVSTPGTTFLPGCRRRCASPRPQLLAFAKPGHITFGSDWPFAPLRAGKLFAAGLENFPLDSATREAIDRTNALALFPRLGTAPTAAPRALPHTVKRLASRVVMRGVARIMASS
jgi:hypothetical protein